MITTMSLTIGTYGLYIEQKQQADLVGETTLQTLVAEYFMIFCKKNVFNSINFADST